jgi:hypothetical protein
MIKQTLNVFSIPSGILIVVIVVISAVVRINTCFLPANTSITIVDIVVGVVIIVGVVIVVVGVIGGVGAIKVIGKCCPSRCDAPRSGR